MLKLPECDLEKGAEISSQVISTWITYASLYSAVNAGAYTEKGDVLHGIRSGHVHMQD